MRTEIVATYVYPGVILGETDQKVLKATDLISAEKEALTNLPPRADAFYLTEMRIVEGTYEDGSKAEKPEVIKISGIYYPGGSIEFPEQLRAKGETIFAMNIEGNGYSAGVITRLGRGNYFKNEDRLV